MRGIPKNVAALLAALRFRDPRPEALRRLDDAEWRGLLAFCDLAHLTLLLTNLGENLVPDWVRSRIADNVSDNAKRFENILRAYAEISRALADARTEHLVIKGFSFSPGFVRSPRLRMQSDIDLLVSPESIERAREALVGLGYETDRRLAHLPSDHLPQLVRNRGRQWRGNFFDPGMPPSVELHFCLWNEAIMRFPAPGVERFWGRRVTRRLEEVDFPGLDPVDNLGFCALQALRDLLRQDWIVHRVYELARFLHVNAADSQLWAAWRERHEDSLRSLQAISFSLAMSWFSCDVPDEVQVQVLNLPAPAQRWLRRFSASPLVRMFQPNKDEVWLHLSLLKSPRDRGAVLRNALLPGRIPGLGATGQDETKFRRARRFRVTQRHARYLLYVLSRIGHHARALFSACCSGIRWRLQGGMR